MADETKREEGGEETGDEKSAVKSAQDSGDVHPKDIKKFSQSEVDSMIGRAAEQAASTIEAKYQEKLEAEKKRLEEERLAEQGKWQEVAQAKEAELARLKAETKEREFVEKCRSTGHELGYDGLVDSALKFRNIQTPEDFKAAIEALHESNEARIKAAVEEALDTGHHASDKSALTSTGKKLLKDMTPKEREAFIEENGVEAYKAKSYEEAGIT